MNMENTKTNISLGAKVNKIFTKNKKQIITASGIIISIFGPICIKILAKNNDDVKKTDSDFSDTSMMEVESCIISKSNEINVGCHPRNLPKGHKASKGKLQFAIDNNMELNDNQTFVNSYTRNS